MNKKSYLEIKKMFRYSEYEMTLQWKWGFIYKIQGSIQQSYGRLAGHTHKLSNTPELDQKHIRIRQYRT